MDLTSISKILIIKLRYIGDVLLSTPVIANLRHHFHDSYIAMVVNRGTEEVLRYNPHLDKIIPLDRSQIRGNLINQTWGSISYIAQIRKEHFDLVIDLTDGDRGAILSFLSGAPIRIGYNAEGKIRGRLYTRIVHPLGLLLHNVEYQLEAVRAIGLPIHFKRLELRWGEEEDRSIQKWLMTKGLADRPFVTMHAGARWWFKQWPLDRFAFLAESLREQFDLETVFLVGEKEQEELKEIQRYMRHPSIAAQGLTLLQMTALIKRSQLFIGNDNGPMHIAASVGTPVVALFGSSDPKVWGPWGEGHRVIYKGAFCSPCDHTGCEMGELNCMRQIHLSDVTKEIGQLWQRRENAIHSSTE